MPHTRRRPASHHKSPVEQRTPCARLHIDEDGFDFYVALYPGHTMADLQMAMETADVMGYVPLSDEEQERLPEADGSVRLYLIPKHNEFDWQVP